MYRSPLENVAYELVLSSPAVTKHVSFVLLGQWVRWEASGHTTNTILSLSNNMTPSFLHRVIIEDLSVISFQEQYAPHWFISSLCWSISKKIKSIASGKNEIELVNDDCNGFVSGFIWCSKGVFSVRVFGDAYCNETRLCFCYGKNQKK